MFINKLQYISYLEFTLIPDLISEGKWETAKDFMAAVLFIKGSEAVNYWTEEVEDAEAVVTSEQTISDRSDEDIPF